MRRYQFLSADWLAQARAIRDEYEVDYSVDAASQIRANLVFTDAPDGGEVHAHIAASTHGVSLELGHLDMPDATVKTTYRTAKAIFGEMDFASSMRAFMAGEIMVDGDISKLLELMTKVSDESDPINIEIAKRVREMTLD